MPACRIGSYGQERWSSSGKPAIGAGVNNCRHVRQISDFFASVAGSSGHDHLLVLSPHVLDGFANQLIKDIQIDFCKSFDVQARLAGFVFAQFEH